MVFKSLRFLVALPICTGLLVSAEMSSRPQAVSTPLAFEVASVKAVPPGWHGLTFACRGINGTIPDKVADVAGAPRDVPQGRCTGGFNLRFLAAYAYDVDVRNVSGGPAWATVPSEFFEIEATAENTATATKDALRQMLQNLLADRFKLKVHRETRQVQGYALVIAKGGAKLNEAAKDAKEGYTGSPNPAARTMTLKGNGSLSYLAYVLAGIVKGPVIDKTGMPGIYAFSFTYPIGPLGSAEDLGAPSIFTAIQEDLGLHLDSIPKVPIDVLIIDSAEKPAQN